MFRIAWLLTCFGSGNQEAPAGLYLTVFKMRVWTLSKCQSDPFLSHVFQSSTIWSLADRKFSLISKWFLGTQTELWSQRDISTEMIQISSGAYGIVWSILLVLFDYEGASPVSAEHFPCATARNTEQALSATQLKGVTQTWRKSRAPPWPDIARADQ